jgi:hypothetical protein
MEGGTGSRPAPLPAIFPPFGLRDSNAPALILGRARNDACVACLIPWEHPEERSARTQCGVRPGSNSAGSIVA